jgi:nuclear pore complex protein Nup62
MIHEVNALSAPSGAGGASGDGSGALTANGEDAVSQIVAILNAHLGSLRWIDETAESLREKIENLRRGNTAPTQPSQSYGAQQSLRGSQRGGSAAPSYRASVTPSREASAGLGASRRGYGF